MPVEIQTIAVLREGDLMEGQMKEVGFGAEGGKVLLSRLGNGTVHATSAFCTHNGVPLVNGTISGDGRVMCPEHGACFNVCTGDIEDAPARSAIHSFKAEVAASHIFVTANPADTLPIHKSRSFTLRRQDFATDGLGVVVVGGGAGALNLIESLRENGYTKSITMISSEPYAPIDRTMLSKENITDARKIELRSVSDLVENFGVTFRSGVTVTAIDPTAKHVEISGGQKVGYEKVVLAMGGAARRLDLYERENVYTLRCVQDAKNIDAALKDGKRLVLVGGSFISMELIVAFQERKFASIDVVCSETCPFQKTLGTVVGKGLQKHFEKQGVKFHLGFRATEMLPSKSKVPATAVVLDNGTNILGDIFVTGIGVVPATEFLKNSGIPLEHDQGIKVDKFLCVPNFDGVYAIGDIAMYPDASGHSARIEHWNVASNHGRAVGRHIMGNHEPFGKMPFSWSTLGHKHALRYVGNIEKFEDSDVIVQGIPEEPNFVAYYTKKDKVFAIASMRRDPIVAKCSELLRLGLMPSRSDIEAGTDPLEIDISIVKRKGLCGGH